MAGAATLAVVGLVEVAAAWWRAEEEKTNGNALAQAHLQIKQALAPLADAASQQESGDQALFSLACQHAAASVVSYVTAPGARAIVYEVQRGNKKMRPTAHFGREGTSKGFDKADQRGRDAFAALESGLTVHCRDIEADRATRPGAWSGSGEGYRSFVTVPLVVGNRGYGLLTTDSPEPDAYSENDRAFVELAAKILAISFVNLKRSSNGPRKGAQQ